MRVLSIDASIEHWKRMIAWASTQPQAADPSPSAQAAANEQAGLIHTALARLSDDEQRQRAGERNGKHAEAERGKVTGTPVGCACGDGVIDWAKVVSILAGGGFSGVLSVECGTPEQAARSLEHLKTVLRKAGVDKK
jgi:hypothetical protein